MKKMLFSAALAMLITGCAQQTFTVGNKPTAVTPKETITHHFFVCKRLARTVLIFTERSDQLSRATDRAPGLPASPGYAQ